MRSIIGLILIVGGIALGYYGYTRYQNSKEGVKIGSIEISATNKDNQTDSFLIMGCGAIALIAGAVILSKKSK